MGKFVGVMILLGALAAVYAVWNKNETQGISSRQQVVIPAFSAAAQKGLELFNKNCAQCHGVNALGTEQGPPLLHDIYNPGHHSDMAFYRAVQSGVPQHHWRFGNMLPQRHVSRKQTELIIAYIRELQRANGIKYKKHQM
ncbi:c-type cytochrome [Luteithermobacter gelatinilyticus]|uniref:c-type cytochrome n=1 Tax=Luteithermobacter gelatinilyticus TaxID=2582913 RepID=UPI001AEFF1D2|nr:cytochrome c [Luteithermobacter gelatinilyticus]